MITLSTSPSHSATVPARCSETPGPRHHHRAVRGGEIACHPFDLDAREVASRCQIVEVGVGDETAQFLDARCEFGAVLSML